MFKGFTTVLVLTLALGGVAAAQKPVPQLPRVYIDTTWNLPLGGTAWAAHTSVQLTSALQTAAPGDIIVLDAGTIYSGYFVVPAKSNANKKWIYVTSSAYAKLPTPGMRVSPANAVNMPKIVSPGATNAVRFADGANHWRFVGIEIYSNSNYHQSGYTTGVNFGYALVDKFSYPGTSTSPIRSSLIAAMYMAIPRTIYKRVSRGTSAISQSWTATSRTSMRRVSIRRLWSPILLPDRSSW